MSKHLQIDNKKYISSVTAGSTVGYSSDYLSRLCRSGMLDCRRIGRVWFIAEDSLDSFVSRKGSGTEVAKAESRESEITSNGNTFNENVSEDTSTIPEIEVQAEDVPVTRKFVRNTFAAKDFEAIQQAEEMEMPVIEKASTTVAGEEKRHLSHSLPRELERAQHMSVPSAPVPSPIQRKNIQPKVRKPEVSEITLETSSSKKTFGPVVGFIAAALVISSGGYIYARVSDTPAHTFVRNHAATAQVGFEYITAHAFLKQKELVNNTEVPTSDSSLLKVSFNDTEAAVDKFSDSILAYGLKPANAVAAALSSFNTKKIQSVLTSGLAGTTSFVEDVWNEMVETSRNAVADVVELSDMILTFGTKPSDAIATAFSSLAALNQKALQDEAGSLYVTSGNSDEASGVIAEAVPQVIEQTIVNQPIMERVVEQHFTVIESGVTLDQLQQTENELRKLFGEYASRGPVQPIQNFRNIALTQKIDNLGSVDITNSTFSGGTISDSSASLTTLTTTGNTSIGGEITVSGSSTFSDDVTFNGSTTFTSTPSFTDLTLSGDLAVNGGDITTTATSWNFDVADTGTIQFRDGTNTLFTITDQGTTGDVTISGDLTISGDDITLGTNTSGFILIADGTNFNPVAVGGDITISATGTVAIAAGVVGNEELEFDTGQNLTTSSSPTFASLTLGQVLATQFASDYSTTGLQNNVSLGDASAVRYTGAGTATFTGITGGVNGRIMYLHNDSADALTLSNESGSSTAGNRIITGTGSDLEIAAGSSIAMQYDATESRWRVVGGSGSGGASTFADLTDTDLASLVAGQLAIYDGVDSWDNITLNGDATLTATGTLAIAANAVALGTDTTGNYLATLVDAGNSFFTITGSGSESAAVTLDIANDSLDFAQLSDTLTLDATTTVAMTGALNFDSNTLYIDGVNNRVGVGTASPDSALHVSSTNGGGSSNWYDPANYAGTVHNNSNGVQRYGLLVSNRWRSSENYVFAVDGRFTNGGGTVAEDTHNPYFIVRGDGNIGIGTSTPANRLQVFETAADAQLKLSYDATRYSQFQTDSAGDLIIDAQGGDVYLNDENLFVCTGGSCPSGTPAAGGSLTVESGVGIGVVPTTAAALSFAATAGSGSFDGYDDFKVLLYDNGTATTSYGIGIESNTLAFNSNSDYDFYIAGAATPEVSINNATSTFQGDIVIAGKLDVDTIDPVYTISGVKYATYGHSTVGVKEEAAMKLTLDKYDESQNLYYTTIDFDELARGSDLWLFYQVSNFGNEWNDLLVNLTPAFKGSAHYKENVKENSITIYGDKKGQVSARFIANRYDAAEWPNLRKDQDGGHPGHVIEEK